MQVYRLMSVSLVLSAGPPAAMSLLVQSPLGCLTAQVTRVSHAGQVCIYTRGLQSGAKQLSC